MASQWFAVWICFESMYRLETLLERWITLRHPVSFSLRFSITVQHAWSGTKFWLRFITKKWMYCRNGSQLSRASTFVLLWPISTKHKESGYRNYNWMLPQRVYLQPKPLRNDFSRFTMRPLQQYCWEQWLFCFSNLRVLIDRTWSD